MCGLHQILKPAISFRVGEAHLRPLKGRGNPLDCHVFFLYTIVFLGNLGTYFRDRFNPPKHNGWIFLHRDGGLKVFPCFFLGGRMMLVFRGALQTHPSMTWSDTIYVRPDRSWIMPDDRLLKEETKQLFNQQSLFACFVFLWVTLQKTVVFAWTMWVWSQYEAPISSISRIMMPNISNLITLWCTNQLPWQIPESCLVKSKWSMFHR